MDDLDRLLGATTPSEAETLRLELESAFAPHQVLQGGAGSLVRRFVAEIPHASSAVVRELWELLAQLAAGVAGPSAATSGAVAETRVALRESIPVVAQHLVSSGSGASDFLAVDVLDAVYDHLDHASQMEVGEALTCFAARGDREARRARLVLGDRR